MKKLTFILLIILSTVFASADYERELFSGYVLNNEVKSIESENYSFLVYENLNKVLVELPTSAKLTILNNTCEIKDYTEVCLNTIDIVEKNMPNENWTYKADVTITAFEPEIELTKAIKQQSLLPGEYTTASISIKNTGSRDTTFYLYDEINSSFLITESRNCKAQKDYVYWSDFLPVNTEKTCTFTLKALTPFENPLKTILNYTIGKKLASLSASTQFEINPPPLNITVSQSRSIAYLGSAVFTMQLSNPDDNFSIGSIALSISVPQAVEISEIFSPLEKRDYYSLYWNGKLEKDSSQNLRFDAKALRYGPSELKYSVTYVFNRRNFALDSSYTIDIPYPNLSVSLSRQDFKSSSPSDIKIEIKNNDISPVYSLKVSAFSKILQLANSSHAGSLEPTKTFILNLPVFPVYVPDNRTETLNITLDFTAINSQPITLSFLFPVNMTASDKKTDDEKIIDDKEEKTDDEEIKKENQTPQPETDTKEQIDNIAIQQQDTEKEDIKENSNLVEEEKPLSETSAEEKRLNKSTIKILIIILSAIAAGILLRFFRSLSKT